MSARTRERRSPFSRLFLKLRAIASSSARKSSGSPVLDLLGIVLCPTCGCRAQTDSGYHGENSPRGSILDATIICGIGVAASVACWNVAHHAPKVVSCAYGDATNDLRSVVRCPRSGATATPSPRTSSASERARAGGLMVGLIGEGQEIHLGEEAGLGRWNDALACMPEPWVIHCPVKMPGQDRPPPLGGGGDGRAHPGAAV